MYLYAGSTDITVLTQDKVKTLYGNSTTFKEHFATISLSSNTITKGINFQSDLLF